VDNATEEPVFFECAGERLLGILHHASGPASEVGLVLVVGGPQYRVGSHRQFVLLARGLAAQGIPVFRFDYRGMGDSTGGRREFDDIEEDIRSAVDAFMRNGPRMRGVVLWGLCDAASANACYAILDDRVVGQIAVNPWVRTEESEARTLIRHYYPKRAMSGSFWRQIASMQHDTISAVRDFLGKLGSSVGLRSAAPDPNATPLPERMRNAQIGFSGPVMIVVSGRDLTAKEYLDSVDACSEWRDWLNSATTELRVLEGADHTFSRSSWRDQLAAWSAAWIKESFPSDFPHTSISSGAGWLRKR
jgi:exosortase A-associated hydrolase 1